MKNHVHKFEDEFDQFLLDVESGRFGQRGYPVPVTLVNKLDYLTRLARASNQMKRKCVCGRTAQTRGSHKGRWYWSCNRMTCWSKRFK